ncbi:DUF4113 domain-containing protein [Zafaria sp. Z1313]|uniref:DinB/UmuC family translesion DNA polymerase n=1 Tax=Zafaria sp. Z1313 TaxID=3423202 RepID=UPI003D302B26
MGRFGAWQEVYSIDESFLGLPEAGEDVLASTAREVRSAVALHVGVPVCVGVAPTKTLAKFANHVAKRNPGLGGVCSLGSLPPGELERIQSRLPATDVWGVGRKSGEKLAALGIGTIAALRAADPLMIRKRFSVVMQRTVLELNGTPCIAPVDERADQQQVMFSRSFSTPVDTAAQMEEVMSVYAQKAAGRLAAKGLRASVVTVSAGTSRFAHGTQSFPSASVPLPVPTDDPIRITRAAVAAMRGRFEPGAAYVRAGVMLSGLGRGGQAEQLDLFSGLAEGEDDADAAAGAPGGGAAGGRAGARPGRAADPTGGVEGLGALLGSVRARFGEAAIGLGQGGLAEPAAWSMKREFSSPKYTTEWSELPRVRA